MPETDNENEREEGHTAAQGSTVYGDEDGSNLQSDLTGRGGRETWDVRRASVMSSPLRIESNSRTRACVCGY